MKKSKLKLQKIFYTTLIFSALFISCKKSEKPSVEKNTKPQLELSFSKKTDSVPLSFLTTVIGTGSGESETFGEQKNLLVFFEEEDCTTCKKVKPVLEEFINSTGCKIYSYTENSSDSIQEREDFLKKLGSSDGQELTAARLTAFVKGKRVASISGSFDLESAEKIQKFAERFFTLPPETNAQELEQLTGLKDLRQRISKNEKFVLYMDRYSCPYCRALEDTENFNTITYIAENTKARIFTLTTEHSMKELNSPVTIDGQNFNSAFEYLEKNGLQKDLWAKEKNQKKLTEYIQLLTVLKEVPASPDDDETFFKSIAMYCPSEKKSEKFFLPSDRNVPCFALSESNFSDTQQKKLISLLQECYTTVIKADETYSEETAISLPNRSLFLNYYAPSSSKLGKEKYNSYLTAWIKYGLF